ncbi:MAG TPA: hypothetical protein VFC99_00930 [Acidimicrobiia bacterium]|nr:hypothetical protein [Acidimicrobiia bacterium]
MTQLSDDRDRSAELPAPPQPRSRRRTREAHFAVASLVVDGQHWPVRYASLDIYHHGPDFDDATAATWEVQCTSSPDADRLDVGREYDVEVETRTGRCFAGRAFAQHASTEICTLLDTGTPLAGLRAADYA